MSGANLPHSAVDPGLVFVTGCYRSGTTLLQKLLDSHPDLSVAMQPFPVLYFDVKERFLSDLGLDWRYPLDHLFLEERYDWRGLGAFLDRLSLSGDDLDHLFTRLAAYGGYTPGAEGLRSRVRPGRFFDVYRQWNVAVAEIGGRIGASVVGNKEIFCEEFVPAFLEAGTNAVLILRDPRDLIASIHHRVLDNQTGDPRPVLYSLRAWRKSVAIALAYASSPAFRWLRYEDLTADPSGQLQAISALLGVSRFEEGAFAEGIRLRDGSIWSSNSSFEGMVGISAASRGRYRKVLSDDVVRYIEAVCAPEMAAVGYALEESGEASEGLLLGFQEPAPRVHRIFAPDYSRSSPRIARELERLRHLVPGSPALSDDEARRWFIHPAAYSALRSAVRGRGAPS